MWTKRVCCIAAILGSLCAFETLASDIPRLSGQVNAILKFYQKVTSDTQPSASDFFELFGRDNESELELILRQSFPKLNPKENWFSDQKASEYVSKVYSNPIQYPSRFMKCLRDSRPDLFLNHTKRQIKFSPEITGDFRNFKVITSEKILIFQFSKEENLIENIYLPEGKSIYTLIEKCVGLP